MDKYKMRILFEDKKIFLNVMFHNYSGNFKLRKH